MAIKLFGSSASQSGCTRCVLTVLKEKNVPYEFFAVDLVKGEQKAPEYLKKQPFGQVPYIDDDGFVLFESRAISRYIAAKYRDQGTRGLLPDPSDIKANALFEQAVSIETSSFDPFVSRISFEKFVKPIRGGITDEALLSNLAATLSEKLKGYEAILSRQKYMAGDEITLADLFHLPYGSSLAPAGLSLLESNKYPNVARKVLVSSWPGIMHYDSRPLSRWWKDISSRPSWQAVQTGQ